MCDGKVRFDSPQLAHAVARRRKRTKGLQQVYRCRHCNGYHQGTPPR